MTARFTPGSPALAFTLLNTEGTPVSLPDHLPRAVIVYFYPVVMTPGCTTQAVDFTGVRVAFAAAGYTIIGISSDTAEKLVRFTAGSKIGFPLLSDSEHEALNAYGAFGTKKLYGKEIEEVLRSTFVIDVDAEGNRTIQVAQYNVRATGYIVKLCRELSV